MPKGLHDKYEVRKRDGTPVDEKAVYFVLRLDTDEAARAALWNYVWDSRADPELRHDLSGLLMGLGSKAKRAG